MVLPSGQLLPHILLKVAHGLLGFHFIFYIGNSKMSLEITKYLCSFFFLECLAAVLCVIYPLFI